MEYDARRLPDDFYCEKKIEDDVVFPEEILADYEGELSEGDFSNAPPPWSQWSQWQNWPNG